jgi:hypothetical protein
MLSEECQELRRWPVVRQLGWNGAFMLEHRIKQTLPDSTALTTFVYVEIKNAQWIHLFESILHACAVRSRSNQRRRSYKQPFGSNL